MYCSLVQLCSALHSRSDVRVGAADSHCDPAAQGARIAAQMRSLVAVGASVSNSEALHTVSKEHVRSEFVVAGTLSYSDGRQGVVEPHTRSDVAVSGMSSN